MNPTEIVPIGNNMPSIGSTGASLDQLVHLLRGMSDMMKATNDRIADLEQQVRLLTKVTPAQATAINTAIRSRAAALCAARRMPPGCEKDVANRLRRDIRLATGVQSMRDLPRCDYAVTMQRVEMWDDYKAIRAIRDKAAGRAAT